MTQSEKQTIVCLFGAKVLVEKLSQNEYFINGGDLVKEQFGEAAALLDRCCRTIMQAIPSDQRREIEAVTRTYKLVMMPEYDPNAKVKKYMIADSDMQVILKHLYDDCCHLCTKDKTAVKYCGASTSWDEVKEEAIELWNERAKPSLPFETIEWHEIKYRDLTEEEKAYYEEHDDYVPDYMFDFHMPDDGDEILIATKYGVDKDVASIDYGCFLEGRGDWEDVIAWAYMPKYKAKENE